MTAEIGTGITVAFGTTTTFTARILGVIFSGISRPVIPDHDMSSTHMDKVPGKVEDWGSVDVEFEMNQQEIEGASGPPIEADPELITFKWPLLDTHSTQAELAGQGFVNNFTFGAPFEERQVGTFTVTWEGKPVHTPGAV